MQAWKSVNADKLVLTANVNPSVCLLAFPILQRVEGFRLLSAATV